MDPNDIRTDIVKADKKIIYRCPVCKGELVQKRGKVNQWHFAHKSKVECDEWYDSKGKWHRFMQGLFLPKYQEQPVSADGQRHIADVLLPSQTPQGKKGTVIEFQKSAIPRHKFYDRSFFYIDNDYRLIWVFDFRDKDVFWSSGDRFIWPHHVRSLDNANDHMEDTDIIFLISAITEWNEEPQTYFDGYEKHEYYKKIPINSSREDIFVRVRWQDRNYKYFSGDWEEGNVRGFQSILKRIKAI